MSHIEKTVALRKARRDNRRSLYLGIPSGAIAAKDLIFNSYHSAPSRTLFVISAATSVISGLVFVDSRMRIGGLARGLRKPARVEASSLKRDDSERLDMSL